MTPTTPAELRAWAAEMDGCAKMEFASGNESRARDDREAAAIARAHADALEKLAEVERERDKARKTAGKLFDEHLALIEKYSAAEAEAARLRTALEYIAEEHDAGRHDGLPEPCPAHTDAEMWLAARAALSPVAEADPLTVCPHADGNTCEQYRLQGMRCQTCPWMRAAGEAEPMASETKAACGNCRYRHDLGDRRVCRRYPPDWPAIADSWWCGEFKPKAAALSEEDRGR